MYRTAAEYLFPLLLISIFFFSCVPQKKALLQQQQLAIIDSQLVKHNLQLKELNTRRQQKQDLNQMDDAASSQIQNFIDNTNTEIDKIVTQNSILVGKTAVDKNDWKSLNNALTFSQSKQKLIGDKLLLITELINRNTVVMLDQDVLFTPGQYNLSPFVSYTLGKTFEPVVKEIDYFVNKYPDFPLSLVITAKGYADATTISDKSVLFKKLQDRLKLSNTNPTNEDLNKELSNARAQSVINLLKTFTVGKSADGKSIKNILYLYEGKGEKLPDLKITNYKAEDSRRRIVLLFWSIFPD